jgi:hypothetical protein
MTTKIEKGYVTDGERWMVQLPDETSRWGFRIHSDDQEWDGGIGSGLREWRLVPEAEVPAEVRGELGWILE